MSYIKHEYEMLLVNVKFEIGTETEHNCIIMLFPSLNLELKPTPCDSSPCKNDGICSNEGMMFSCECTRDYEGKTCEGIVAFYSIYVKPQSLVSYDLFIQVFYFWYVRFGETNLFF